MAIEWSKDSCEINGVPQEIHTMNFTMGEDGPSSGVLLWMGNAGYYMISSKSLGWGAQPVGEKNTSLGEAKRATEAKVLSHYYDLAKLYDTMRCGIGEDIIKKEREVKDAIVAKVKSLVDDGHSPERPVKSHMVTTADYDEAFSVAMKSYGEENIVEVAENAAERMVKEVAKRRGLSSYLSSDAETSKSEDILGSEANQMLQNIKNSLHGNATEVGTPSAEHEDDESLER